MTTPRLSVVLPCYNEARGLAGILRRFAEVDAGQDYELLLVDNGSRDNTQEVLGQLLPEHPRARCVPIEINQGYGHGIYTGLQAARGELLAWSHADLQTDPGDVFRALARLEQSPAPERVLVKGHRYGRRVGERIISRGMEVVALLLLRRCLREINAQPKLFHRGLLQHLNAPPPGFNFDVYVLYRAVSNGWTVDSIPVQFPPRPYGQSNWAATWRSKCRTIAHSVAFMLRLGLGRA
jgi:glycosyltransferase involved in cell wall biosynthesis